VYVEHQGVGLWAGCVCAMVEEVGVPRFDEVASPGVHVAVSNPTLNLLGRN
jgi:hypothetical protein